MQTSINRLVYSKAELLTLENNVKAGVRHLIPPELRRKYRGCRARRKHKAKMKARITNRTLFKPPIPSVVMGNVNALTNKMDELTALIGSQRSYTEASLLIFTETWLTSYVPDATVDLPGFSVVRADRDPDASGKSKGGGLILYANQRWCHPNHLTVKTALCSRDLELLAVSIRPYYVPREFSHVIALCVYVPPRADAEAARESIYNITTALQSQHPDAFFLISGDFNHVTLDTTLASFHQYVSCHTRKNRTIDLLYANINDAYSVSPLPPLGKSDHNLVHLKPTYTPLVKRQIVTTRQIRRWSPEAEDALRDCFATTDWSVLVDSYGEDLEGAVGCLTDYLNFCVDQVVPVKTVRCFANNKPWITSEVKKVLNKKKRAFGSKNGEVLRDVQKEVKICLKGAHEAYSKKLEKQLSNNSMREVWNGMKTITGCRSKGSVGCPDLQKAEELNTFLNRFSLPMTTGSTPHPSSAPLDHHHLAPPAHGSLSLSRTLTTPTSTPSLPTITAVQVTTELLHLHPRKAAGPDQVCPRLLKTCAAELGGPLQQVYNLSLRLGRVPSLWKTSCIVPVPKKGRPQELNDYRPVALTSHLMKILERLVLQFLQPQVQLVKDPLQFAYQEKVGVEDAVLYLLHRALAYLDVGGCMVRMLFFDFSGAFNTIHPSLLQEKLNIMAVDPYLVNWITDYLTNRPQFVRVGGGRSSTLTCSIGAPQGTVLSPFLFTLYTSDFRYNSDTCHMQKFSDDTAIVACIRGGEEGEYRDLVKDFVGWCQRNNLQLNTTKTKEVVLDFRRAPSSLQPIGINGSAVEMVSTYRYLGLQLDNKLSWSANMDSVYKKGQSRLYFLRRLASFRVCSKLLYMFYQSIVSSVLFYAVVCWGGSAKRKDIQRLNRLVRKACSVVGLSLDSVEKVLEQRTLSKIRAILSNESHPLNSVFSHQRSTMSSRLLSLRCSTERLKNSFVPGAIRLYNAAISGVLHVMQH
ncbi:uncharacterized protein LOC118471519 [Amphiprion ocellaris]|uniref:uncharacterized protein LOC118471519 n=1 Tax=Amphiprion ocellaris TaxID=80972 RepID=UPI002410B7D6|nr:uncharacterized protein LOC118471519 [Amphiprion ocellaris]